ncbi:exosortase Y-associated Wzy-like protein [Mucilaginibacter myungsuensis]|uniref:Oligosaccharide repeat unit polymerase n=1 Tax=Mucilaginibacter myungsuensis TaxID=649104 RepID=A0A929KYA2_9SPHI|nr:hypothetical protein [Mucilaginibacter myungsuensis]MBE9660840.1 hypothetical protein [Mucilaginibacter myungsuensis]MDN3600887.1 hypothetical protein [Mucilaginibacter myungsuensis]
MDSELRIERFAMLYIPYALALLLADDPYWSYLIAWLGSFYIFFLTLSGSIRPLPDDHPLGEQLMRPIFLVQIVFAGYMACTSIFYFMDLVGYVNFEEVDNFFFTNTEKLKYTAEAQRYYCLGHAAFVTGILMFMKYPTEQRYIYAEGTVSAILFYSALLSFPIAKAFEFVPGLSQFTNQFNSLSFIACSLALAFAIPERKMINTAICVVLYGINFYSALLSGFKEPIIISVMVLGIFLYPSYKKLVLATFIPALLLLFLVLPTYATVFRSNAWTGDADSEEASQLALQAAIGQVSDSGESSNWSFLVGRFSEISMFTMYLESTPKKIDFYDFQLLEQSAMVLVPRIFWPAKPFTETLVMQRVYDAGVVARGSVVSAKPAYIVDGYLSFGTLGVIISLFVYGMVAQLISQKAEVLFGGYLLGTALMFSGLFQILWRGLSFEFIINSVFYSYVTMLMLHKVFLARNIIQPA